MSPFTTSWFRAGIPLLLIAALLPALPANEPQRTWSQKATRQYLDSRVSWWLNWSPADRGQGTTCASCHTTLPYALALPVLSILPGNGSAPEPGKQLLAGVRKRVERWDSLAKPEPRDTEEALTPIFGGAKRETSLDTESVLNALVLVVNDPASNSRLSDTATKSLDILWARQQANGAWKWLEFGLRPWEKDGDYFGATLAAVAIGTAGSKYPRHEAMDNVSKTQALRSFLKTRLAEKPLLHNRARFSLGGEPPFKPVHRGREGEDDRCFVRYPKPRRWLEFARARKVGYRARETWLGYSFFLPERCGQRRLCHRPGRTCVERGRSELPVRTLAKGNRVADRTPVG